MLISADETKRKLSSRARFQRQRREAVANQLKFTRYVALGIVCAFALLMQGVNAQTQPQTQSRPFELMEATIPQLQTALTAGTTTSRDLVKSCAPAAA
jgi:hypothetical protein